jgi:hypothetical protein
METKILIESQSVIMKLSLDILDSIANRFVVIMLKVRFLVFNRFSGVPGKTDDEYTQSKVSMSLCYISFEKNHA